MSKTDKKNHIKVNAIMDTIQGVLDANWIIKSWSMSFVDQRLVVEFDYNK